MSQARAGQVECPPARTGRMAKAERLALLTVALLTGGATAVSAQVVVVPNARATVEGNSNSNSPFGRGIGNAVRYQQVYASAELVAGTVVEIRFRQDAETGAPFGPTTFPSATITLSTTSAGPDALSTTFASNVGADVTTVFSGPLVLSSAPSIATPRPFDIVIPLTTPFPYDPAAGNLLFDITLTASGPSNQLDGENTLADSVSIVWNDQITPVLAETDGLVTQFTIVPAVPVLPRAALASLVAALGCVALWWLRRERLA